MCSRDVVREMGFITSAVDGHDVKALIDAQQCEEAARAPVPQCDAQGQRYARRSPSDKWHGPVVRSGSGRYSRNHTGRLFADFRPVALRHGRAHPYHRHHAGDREVGPGRILEAVPTGTTTSPSRNTRVTFALLACEASFPWSRYTRRFCNAPTISSFTTSRTESAGGFELDRAGLVARRRNHQGSYD